MTTVIRNQGTSLAVREKLAADGRPVLLAFSCGKDSIAAWLAMRDMGIEVVPAYLYYVPGLRFVDEDLIISSRSSRPESKGIRTRRCTVG